MVLAVKIMSYEQELDINDPKFNDEVAEKLLMSPKQFYRRIKLESGNLERVQLLSDIDEYYAFYITYLKNDKRFYVRLGLRPWKLGFITDIVEQMISNGHFEYEGDFMEFIYKGKAIKALPQKYVSSESETGWNKERNRFLIFGHYTGQMAYKIIDSRNC